MRCNWVTEDPLYIEYHDHEWGQPVYDDRMLFEMLTLEGAQAGLSWITILNKREQYRNAFDSFHIEKVACYDENKVQALLLNKGIIRNEKKIRSTINNARQMTKIQNEFESFSNYLWNFVDGEPIINHWKMNIEVPTQTKLSMKISKDLKKRGFTFVGPTIIYSYMQAVGLVNDHILTCFCHPESL